MEYINVVVDAMGTDFAPEPEVKGAMAAIKLIDNLRVTLIGDKNEIDKHLTDDTRIEVIHAEEFVDINKEPVMEIRKKRKSSMVLAFGKVKTTDDTAFVSGGSTGAIVAGAQLLVGRIKGIKRPALAPIVPTVDGEGVILCDVGATPEIKLDFIIQNAIMANAYAKVRGIENPRIGLLNIGAEEKKGSEVYIEVHKKLKEFDFNFIGNVEARDLTSSDADVIVCDGFTGNVAIKVMEGSVKTLLSIIKTQLKSTITSMFGAILASGAFKRVKMALDYEETGGALLLGIKKPIIKAHGSSNDKALMNAIILAHKTVEQNLIETIESNI